MRAIVIERYGGPEQLAIRELPDPVPLPDHVVIEVKAFGLNHAEINFRKGVWGEVAKVTGIECVGVARADLGGHFAVGQKVAALMGGMGRTFNGSYAEYARVPAANVVPVYTALPWVEFAALPKSYATAWTCLNRNLALTAGQVLLVRGATSALGHAAVNIAANAGAHVIGTRRNLDRFQTLEALGVTTPVLEASDLSRKIRQLHSRCIDAVLDLVGSRRILDSLAAVRLTAACAWQDSLVAQHQSTRSILCCTCRAVFISASSLAHSRSAMRNIHSLVFRSRR
jgi:NADPH:quinone reductase-like Zn-dependent oxidoreductase